MSVKTQIIRVKEVFIMSDRMKRMSVEALFKDDDTEYYHMVHLKSDRKYDLKEEVEYLTKFYNYKLVKCVITNNRVVSMKARLRFCIEELRSLDENTDYYGYEDALINRIGIITSRLLNRGVEVNDEIALQCFDIRQKHIIEQSV